MAIWMLLSIFMLIGAFSLDLAFEHPVKDTSVLSKQTCGEI